MRAGCRGTPYSEVVILRFLLLPVGLVVLVGCAAMQGTPLAAPAPPVTLEANVADRAEDITVDTIVKATATDGAIDSAELYYGDDPDENAVDGEIEDNSWVASERLEPSETYRLTLTGTNIDGEVTTVESTFTTHDLALDEQTYPSVAPLDGETVGVGMPVIIKFDLPVFEKEEFERNLTLSSEPAVEGSWSWLNDREVQYRPKAYWPTGTEVRLQANVNGLHAGEGIYGQQDQDVSFTVGRSVISTVDIAGHSITVAIDGEVARTLPSTAGKDGFVTRSGTKLIMEKHAELRMDAATTGIPEDDPEYYDIHDVKYAMRVTNSGEFIHAAPWSQGSQGRDNVSHGCVGLSVSDAGWFYNQSKRGDVVKFVGSSRDLETQNGWTAWDMSYADFAAGSALS